MPVVNRLSVLVLATLASACIPNGPPTGTADAGAAPVVAAPTVTVAPSAPKKAAAPVDGGVVDPLLTQPFEDTFDRGIIGDAWRTLGGAWRIENGRLCGRGAKNRGIWLTKRLPTNARIEFDATSTSADGDLKAELWGDGMSGATSQSYSNATSYLTILGGWKNTLHVLARLDEHGSNRLVYKVDPTDDDPRSRPVAAGQTYRFVIERTDGKTIRWLVDDVVMHRFEDREPLKGEGHDHFGFNDWDVQVCFDNVKVTPLG